MQMLFFLTFILTFFLVACQGQPTKEPPIVPIQNMYKQSKYVAQSTSDFYKDKRSARPPVEGTVPKDYLFDPALNEGLESLKKKDSYIKHYPFKMTKEDVKKGQELFNIFCTPCHGYSGDADGLVTKRANSSIRPPSFYEKRILTLPVGQIYASIKNGVNNMNMPKFDYKLTVKERWQISAYVRALQLSRLGERKDLEKSAFGSLEKN